MSSPPRRPPPGPRFRRYSVDTLNSFRTSPNNGVMLVLTPLLPPPPHLIEFGGGLHDPFERFATRMVGYNENVMHVQYIPDLGMTDYHELCIQQATSVVVIVCEADWFNSYPELIQQDYVRTRGLSLGYTLRDQMDFAKGVRRIFADAHGAPGGAMEIEPLLCIVVGPPEGTLRYGDGDMHFATVIYTEYDVAKILFVPNMIFEQDGQEPEFIPDEWKSDVECVHDESS